MDIYVLNTKLERIAVIDDYSSVIWVKRYFECGDFELYLPATQRYLDILKIDNYLCRNDDDTVMVIENIQITTDAENGSFIIVTGRSLESIVARRIVWKQTTFSGNVSGLIQKLISDNIISPLITNRKIDNFTFRSLLASSESITKQITGDNLMEAIVAICKTYGYGWRIKLVNKIFVFELYKGLDRSRNQNVNAHVIFSPTFDNLVNSNYKFEHANVANVALVAGEGEGVDRKQSIVGDESGLNRREIYVDARDLSTNEEEPLTDEEYESILTERGNEGLNERVIVESFEGEVETRTTYLYRRDWNIGDIVQVENEFGISANPRIIEIIESEDESGYVVIPTFEEWEV